MQNDSLVSGRILVAGHRGFPARMPENTAESFRAALETGVDIVELDVHLTADGHAAVHHDPTTGRLCERDETVGEMSLDGFRKLRIRGGGGHRCISLNEALAILRPDVVVDVELKGIAEDAPALVAAVRGSLEATGGASRIILTAADPAFLEEAYRCDPKRATLFPAAKNIGIEAYAVLNTAFQQRNTQFWKAPGNTTHQQ